MAYKRRDPICCLPDTNRPICVVQCYRARNRIQEVLNAVFTTHPPSTSRPGYSQMLHRNGPMQNEPIRHGRRTFGTATKRTHPPSRHPRRPDPGPRRFRHHAVGLRSSACSPRVTTGRSRIQRSAWAISLEVPRARHRNGSLGGQAGVIWIRLSAVQPPSSDRSQSGLTR